MKKKILSLFLALTLCLSLLPTAAFAEGDAQDLPEQGEEILVPEQLGEPEEESVLEDEQEGLAGVSAPQTGAANSKIAVQAMGGHSQYHTTICNTYPCTDHKTLTWSAISNVNQLKSATGEDKGYYLTTELELTEPWTPTGTVNLCLNGHSITLNAGTDAAPQSTIEVTSGVQLNIADCKAIVPGSASPEGIYYGGPYVQHADGSVGPGITVLNGGTVELFGGKITQNSDGVVVENGGTLNMPSNSDVSKNTGAGVRLEEGGTLNMSGGYISSNEGCGVDVAQGSTFNVSGGTKILSNTKKGETCNVYLHGGATMKVSGLSTARIGVTVETLPTDGGFVPVTSDGSASRSDQNCITSDDTSYRVVYSTTNSPNNLVLNARPTPLHADHDKTTFVNSLSSSDGKLLINGEEAGTYSYNGTTYYELPDGNYYLEGDLALNRGLLAYSANVVLCLNGHNITVTGTNYVIYTAKKTPSASGSYTFTLTDCADEPGTLTHLNGQGGGVYVRDGTFIMRGGKISGNNSGVYVYQGNTFEIYGGEISGNKSYGVSLTPDSKSYIYMTVGGTAKITGNWENGTYDAENHLYEQGTAGTAKNVWFTAKPYKYITVDSSLKDGAEIGVTIWKTLTAERDCVAVATCGTSSSADVTPYVGYFKSDSDAYKVWSVDNRVVIGVWNLDDQIHPICGAVCNHKDANGDPIHEDIVWTPVSSASQIYSSDNIYLTDDITLTRTWEISGDTGTTQNLCLNGHTITAAGDFDAITIKNNNYTLNICDCKGGGKITHGTKDDSTKYSGSGVYLSAYSGRNVTVNMYGGTITGNTGHSVTVKGTDLTRGGGVYVDDYGTLNMCGGSITGNTAAQGGGVYYSEAGLTVSGNAKITGNTGTDGKANNVWVPYSNNTDGCRPFKIGEGGLQKDAEIGITYDRTIETGKYITFALHAEKGCSESNFTSDKEGDYGFKKEADHDNDPTLRGTEVVNLYNGLPHKHAICGKTAENCTDSSKHADVVWTPLTSENGQPYAGSTKLGTGNFNATEGYVLPAGHYYLNAELALNKPLLIKNGVYLCLNGQTLSVKSSNSAVIIDTGCDLTLCDCSEEQPGKITHADSATGRGVYMGTSQGRADSYKGSFTMYGGSISGNHVETGSGVGVYVCYGTFNMHGGSITDNTTKDSYASGGVHVTGGTFNMTGGSITDNSATSSSATGGGVRVDSKGTFNMSGDAVISNNSGAYSGGGVYVNTATFNMSGSASVSGNSADYGGGVYVTNGTAAAGTFTMSGDASVSGNSANYGGGVYMRESNSKFTMSENAAVSGNTAKAAGGGVNLIGGGTFTMGSGSITGNNVIGANLNSSGGGVYVDNGTFNMTGGTISGNNVTHSDNMHDNEGGGGVYVAENATMNVSGNVQITGNWKNGTLNNGVYEKGVTGSDNNLYLYAYNSGTPKVLKTVTIDSTGLASTAEIGITTRYTPTASNPIKIATGAQENVDYTGIFTPDVTGQGYTIILPEGETNLYLSAHQHSWQYTVNTKGDTITATCTDTTCTSPNGGSVTIAAPDENTLTYDGNTKEATLKGALTTGVTLTTNDIKYYHKIGEQEYQLEADAKPTNAKSYRAEITVDGVNASVTYEIKKATPQASDFLFSGPNDPTYDGNAKFATVTSTKIDGDYITVKYYQGEKEVSNPTDAGTYTVKINVAESGNYNAAPDLTDDPNWKFTIQTNNTAPDVTLSGEMVYKREKIEPTATVKIGNATLVKNQDYTVTYGTNFDAGTNTGVVYIEAKGNYGFTEVIKYFNIAKKTITVTAENKSSRVGQALEKLTYTCDPQPYEGDTFSNELATDANKDVAGEYTIMRGKLTLGDNYNIDFVSGTYTVNAKNEQTNFNFAGVENGKVAKTYGTDKEFTLAATGAATGSTVTYESTDTNVATVDSTTGEVTIKGAGTAVIKATASATDDYAEGVATYELTVNKKTLEAADLEFTSDSTFAKEYDGDTTCTTATVQIRSAAKVNQSDVLPTVTGTYAYDSKDVKGATKVTFTSERTENTNYILPANLTVDHAASITPAELESSGTAAAEATYNTRVKDISISGLTVKMKNTNATVDGTWAWAASAAVDDVPNVGTTTEYQAVFTPTSDADNYQPLTVNICPTINAADGGSKGSVERTQKFTDENPKTETIAWQQLLPAGQTWNYNSSFNTSTGTLAHVDHSVNNNTGALTYTITGGSAGDQITFTVTAKCNNYDDFTYTVTVRLMARDPQTLVFKGVTDGKVAKTYGDAPFTQAVTGAKTDVTYTSSDETVAKVDAQTGKVTIVGAGTATIKAKASETTDFEEKEISYTLTVKKLPIPVPTPGKNELEYDGTTQTYMPDRLDTAYCTITDNTAKDVRANNAHYTATVSLNDKANTEWDIATENDTSNQTYDFWITPATAIVTALDKKITTGQSAPALANAKLGEDYTITGLYGSDSLGSIVLYYADPSNTATEVNPDTSKAGTYAIVAAGGGTGNPNYAPTFHTGTLTIANRPSSGGGAVTYPVSIPDKVENGSVSSDVKNASKGSTVTITIKPEDGFKLANLTVIDKDGNKLEIADKGDGKYTFIMPAGKVEVKASFTKEVETSPFADVSTDAYYYEAVKWAAEQGITGGTGSGLFSPDYTCTRAQIVTFLWRAAGSPEPKAMSGFSDVPENSYYAKAVAWAVENGITVGTSSTTFSPEATCTRAQSVTFLFRAAKASADGTPAFSDVTANAYYAEAVKWATDNGITNGIGGGLFGSNNDCTRAQIVTFLWRLYAGK